MKSRPFLLALLGFAAFSALGGQEDAAPGEGVSDLFSLGILLDAAVSGESPWRPDWPAAMPPDGFTLAAGQARTLTLILPAGYLDKAPGGGAATSDDAATETAEEGDEGAVVEYRLVRDRAGRFLEFPFFIDGALYQGTVEYDGGAPARKITLDKPAAPDSGEAPENSPWEFELLEYRQGDPVLARVNHNGAWSFVAPEYQETRTLETWYDAEGRALGFFALEYRLEDGVKRLVSTDRRSDDQPGAVLAYRYNSLGRISAVAAPEGDYAALYTAAARPRYWERPEGNYTLQWDEQGFLVRLTGVVQGAGAEAEGRQIDIRYEYTLDGRGNWIERRETAFVRRFDRLVPESNAAIRRVINYGDP
jgi:hypothetical protein